MDQDHISVFLIEDNAGDARLIREMLTGAWGAAFELFWEKSLTDGLKGLQGKEVDAILLDLSLPDSQGLEVLDRVQEERPEVAVIILTGFDDEEAAIKAVNRGAQDYLVKGQVDLHLLTRSIRYAIERKRTELDLRNAVQRIDMEKAKSDAIIASIGDGLEIINKEFTITYQNAVSKKMVGDHVGKTCYKSLNSNDSICPACPVERSFNDGKTHRSQRQLKIDGKEVYLDVTASPVRDTTGNIIAGIEVVRDVTERIQAEKALKESEARYFDLFENANDLIQSVNPDGHFAYVNRAWRETLGYTEEEVNRLTIFDIIHPKYKEHTNEMFDQVMAGNNIDKMEVVFRTSDGRKVVLEGGVGANTINGKTVSSRGIFRDITLRKEMEKEKQLMQDQLHQARKMEAIGTLTGGVAHDFNNLLTAIQGYNELTMRAIDESDPKRIHLMAVKEACKRAADIIRQMLFFSRKQPMEFKVISINLVVSNLMKMLGRLIGEDIEVCTDLDTDVWKISADAGNIEQVIMNLTVNARDAMQNGGKLTIKTGNVTIDEDYCRNVNYARPGGYVCLEVADTGTGIDKDLIEHVFEPFFTTKEVGKGTGLGLSGVYGIVKQHKGWINVYSQNGKGTVFKIYLPAVSCDEETDDCIPILSELLHGNGERILLVEDEKSLRELATMALEENGYTVFPARNGEEAHEVFTREKGIFHLIFSDVVLPDKNGLNLIDELKADAPDVKVLLCSGYTDHKAQGSTIKEREIPFMQKPYTLADLLQTVKDMCQ